MVERIDKAVELVTKAKGDRKTLVVALGSALTFSLAVGSIVVYEHLIKKLEDK